MPCQEITMWLTVAQIVIVVAGGIAIYRKINKRSSQKEKTLWDVLPEETRRGTLEILRNGGWKRPTENDKQPGKDSPDDK